MQLDTTTCGSIWSLCDDTQFVKIKKNIDDNKNAERTNSIKNQIEEGRILLSFLPSTSKGREYQTSQSQQLQTRDGSNA